MDDTPDKEPLQITYGWGACPPNSAGAAGRGRHVGEFVRDLGLSGVLAVNSAVRAA